MPEMISWWICCMHLLPQMRQGRFLHLAITCHCRAQPCVAFYKGSAFMMLHCIWLIQYCKADGLYDISIIFDKVNRLHGSAFFEQLLTVGARENYSLIISNVGLWKAQQNMIGYVILYIYYITKYSLYRRFGNQ